MCGWFDPKADKCRIIEITDDVAVVKLCANGLSVDDYGNQTILDISLSHDHRTKAIHFQEPNSEWLLTQNVGYRYKHSCPN